MDDKVVDRIFSGGLDHLPPVSSKIVRIFTSSTFTDTLVERNTLMAEVYPRLKEYCREKHGLEFQVVDMRWGVRDEATDDHMTTELCMREIDNCQRLSMGPNFISFLGQKYGYRPIPTYILTSELMLMREALIGINVDTILLDTWYKPDLNAVPAVSILQSISSILVNFNNKRLPKLQAQDQATWWETLEKMQKLLRKAAATLYADGRMDQEAMHNYFMSVTEREVIRGLLTVKNTKNHCLSYIRIINNINLQNIRKAGLYIDVLNRQVDTEAVRLMANLRDERVPNRIELTNFIKYTIDWIGREGLAADTHEEYIQDFITHFYKSMVRLIDRAMRREDSSPQGQIVTEILQHLHACNNSVKVFHGRDDIVQRIRQYIVGPSHYPLVLYGSGGCGKTSLLAKSASLIFDWLGIEKPTRRESYANVQGEEKENEEKENGSPENETSQTTPDREIPKEEEEDDTFNDREESLASLEPPEEKTSSTKPKPKLGKKNARSSQSSRSSSLASQAGTAAARVNSRNSSTASRNSVTSRSGSLASQTSSQMQVSLTSKVQAKLAPDQRIRVDREPEKLRVGHKLSQASKESKQSLEVKPPKKRVRFSHQAQMLSLQFLQKVRSDSVEKERLEMEARIEEAQAKKDDQPKQVKPLLLLRFCGTTPDSSALAPMLTSLCQQISYNYLIPFEQIPTDLVPLTAYFKELLTYATPEMPMYIFLDSVDQLGSAHDTNKLTWLPTKLPPNVKVVASCSNEPSKPELSSDYRFLRRIIDEQENFVEIEALGTELAIEVIRKWLAECHRDLVPHQWEIVKNAINHCSLPIFVKLVFAEVCRWKSYTKLQDTHLALGVIDSIMMLFQRIEIQHGRLLVFHALAYITASKSGLSETELEDLISLDDIVLDDVYQYHMPPVRRIPPLLWTRIKNDLPNYLSEREADGVSVQNWYHRQFRETALERYFNEESKAIYFHSMIAEYFHGTWGGGKSKPFKFTEMQIMRFNLPNADGEADRKVPLQPLVFQSKDGGVARYNLRKSLCMFMEKLGGLVFSQFGELPYHFIRSKRFDDLFKYVLFNYSWLHAKLAACPLQAVLSDFDDAVIHLDDPHICRQITLVADALRLGGAILSQYPDMLAPQLLSRLLPESKGHDHIKFLLKQCDIDGPNDCALLPVAHCLHTPGGPLKYSLEGHQFAVFGFKLTSDCRYIVSVSNKFLTFDMSTSDLARAVAPRISGIFQGLVLSPDDKYAAAWTNTNQSLILNLLTSEIHLVENPLPASEKIEGLHLLDTNLVMWGSTRWFLLSLQGNILESHPVSEAGFQLLDMVVESATSVVLLFWTGVIEDKKTMVTFWKEGRVVSTIKGYNALAFDSNRRRLFICVDKNGRQVQSFVRKGQLSRQSSASSRSDFVDSVLDRTDSVLSSTRETSCRQNSIFSENEDSVISEAGSLQHVSDGDSGKCGETTVSRNRNAEPAVGLAQEDVESEFIPSLSFESPVCLLQLQLSEDERHLLGSDPLGFSVWPLVGAGNQRLVQPKQRFLLPSGVRNISVRMLKSNSIAISQNDVYAVAGVRKNLYVWNMDSGQLVKSLDAHFGRILEMYPYTLGPWNSIITSSIDRSVKIWNINNIFEQVHAIDRHELQIDSISLCESKEVAVTVTRGCVGIWHLTTGRLVTRLADSPLGAIVTHAVITKSGSHVVAAESGHILIWALSTKKVIYKTEQPHVRQLELICDDDKRFMAISSKRDLTTGESKTLICMRIIPDGVMEFEIETPTKTFRPVVVSSDGQMLMVLGMEKGKDTIFVYQTENGFLVNKFHPKFPGSKEILGLLPIPNKASQVAVLELEKGAIFDVKTKRHLRTLHRWSGKISRCGHFGVHAPSRGGLDLLETKHGNIVRTLIVRTAEGVFTNMTSFSKNNQYVLYYHSGKKTLRVFRVKDGYQIANYRLSAELTAMDTTADGKYVVIGTVDGNLTILYIADPIKEGVAKEVLNLPWRKIQHDPGYKFEKFSFETQTAVVSSPPSEETTKSLSFKTAAQLARSWVATYPNLPKDGNSQSQVCCVM